MSLLIYTSPTNNKRYLIDFFENENKISWNNDENIYYSVYGKVIYNYDNGTTLNNSEGYFKVFYTRSPTEEEMNIYNKIQIFS